MPQHATRIAQHALSNTSCATQTQHALPSQGGAAGGASAYSADSAGADKAGRAQQALRRWVKRIMVGERRRRGEKRRVEEQAQAQAQYAAWEIEEAARLVAVAAEEARQAKFQEWLETQ